MYRLTTFDGIALPIYNPITSWPTPSPRNGYQATSAGVFRADGAGRSHLDFPYTITYKCVALDISDISALRRAIDIWRGRVGEVAELVRRPEDDFANDDEIQRVQAELVSVPYERRSFNTNHIELIFEFAVLEQWRGIGDNPWRLDDGIVLDDGYNLDDGTATTFTVSNGVGGSTSFTNVGTVPSDDVFFSITCGSANLEQIIINSGYSNNPWAFKLGNSGSTLLEPGDTLVMDTGKYEITINGESAYSAFSYFSSHSIDAWARILPGANRIAWVADGGSTDTQLIIQFKPEYI